MRKKRKNTKYASHAIHTLAVFAVLFSFVSVGIRIDQSGLLPYQLMSNVVGVSANIPPNELSRLAQQFDEKERELKARELEIAERERALNATMRDSSKSNLIANSAFAGALILLFILIAINYYQDWKRKRITA
ncbi:MAG: hypothetical protein WDZ88_02900 [Candidatus Paceibacterota bacterium]